jgi:3-deoxy-manno-octulosonate cytidylyltransferase (CMP-KDO synthetase)
MRTICVIPARFHSSRFPGKLLQKAAGRTVLERTLEKALRCPFIDYTYVATDHEEIARHIEAIGAEVVWTSPECRNGTERVAEAIQKIAPADIIVNLQGDHPCTDPQTISAVVNVLREDREALLSTAVTPIETQDDYLSPHVVKCVFDEHRNALYFSRSPIPYCKNEIHAYAHIGIYGYRKTFFDLPAIPPTPLQQSEDLEQLQILERGYRMKVAIVEEKPLGIDTPQDLIKLEQFLCP